jgi:DNA-binding IclR family transcriptional regulator
MSNHERAAAPAVVRAAKVLSHLAASGDAQRLTAIANSIDIPVSSTAAICNALEDERLVVRRRGGYVLGPRTVELAQRYLADLQPVSVFADVVSQHPTLRGETAQLALLDGFDMLYLARHDGDQPFHISSAVGKRLPANCTAVGKACLALRPAAELELPDALPRLTDRSIVDRAALLADLGRTRERGYAIDDEETSPGIVCIGVARETPGLEAYGISATLLKSRATPALREAVASELRAAADSIFPASAIGSSVART